MKQRERETKRGKKFTFEWTCEPSKRTVYTAAVDRKYRHERQGWENATSLCKCSFFLSSFFSLSRPFLFFFSEEDLVDEMSFYCTIFFFLFSRPIPEKRIPIVGRRNSIFPRWMRVIQRRRLVICLTDYWSLFSLHWWQWSSAIKEKVPAVLFLSKPCRQSQRVFCRPRFFWSEQTNWKWNRLLSLRHHVAHVDLFFSLLYFTRWTWGFSGKVSIFSFFFCIYKICRSIFFKSLPPYCTHINNLTNRQTCIGIESALFTPSLFTT